MLMGHVDFQLNTEIFNVLNEYFTWFLDFGCFVFFLFKCKIIAFYLFNLLESQVCCLAELKSLWVRGPGGSRRMYFNYSHIVG